jgi:hypothetical protein
MIRVLIDAPADVAADPHMSAVWIRSRHILPAIAFDSKYWRTVLLPLRTAKTRREVSSLRHVIGRERNLTQMRLVELARVEFGVPSTRSKALLPMRRGLEWDWLVIDVPARHHSLVAIEDSPIAALIPNDPPIEYLVAEFERHRVEFNVENGRKLILRSARQGLPWGEIDFWLAEYGSRIIDYLTRRDKANGFRP